MVRRILSTSLTLGSGKTGIVRPTWGAESLGVGLARGLNDAHVLPVSRGPQFWQKTKTGGGKTACASIWYGKAGLDGRSGTRRVVT